MAPGDEAFVFDNWLESYRFSPWAGVIPNRDFRTVYTGTHAALIERGAQIYVACSPSDKEQLYGFFVFERGSGFNQPIVHYIFTKNTWRRFGVASKLLGGYVDTRRLYYYTFRTRDFRYMVGAGRHRPGLARIAP